MKTTKQQVNALKPCSIAVYAEAAAYYAAKTNYEEAAAAAFEAVEAYEAARNNK